MNRSTKPLKRTRIARSDPWSFNKQSPSKGRKRLDVPAKPRRAIRRVGPRTKAWANVWRFLKGRMEAAGRTRCEFGFIPHDCWGELFPCHSKKRREMQDDDIYTVAMGCQQIARWLDEDLSHEEMERTVLEAITRAGGLILPERKAA